MAGEFYSERGVVRLRVSSPSVQHSDPIYDDYIQSLLSDFGIQFSPGGSGIVEIEEASSPAQVEEEDQEAEENSEKPLNLKTEGPTSSSDRQESTGLKKPLAVVNHESDEDAALTIDESGGQIPRKAAPGASGPVSPPAKRPKLYQMGALGDPERERRRRNAIFAKRNRDIKKQQIQDLEEKVTKLRRVNTQCSKVLRRTNTDMQQLRHELKTMNSTVSQLTERITNKKREVTQQREKLQLFQAHLDLIGSSLDEDNAARKLIFTLLQRLSSSGSGADTKPGSVADTKPANECPPQHS